MLFHMHNKKVNTLTPKIINIIIEKVEEFNSRHTCKLEKTH